MRKTIWTEAYKKAYQRTYNKKYMAQKRENGLCGICKEEAIEIVFLHHGREIDRRYSWRCPMHTKNKFNANGAIK